MPPSRLLIALAALPGPALAEGAQAIPDAGTSILQMILGLVVVLGMLVATLWVMKRLAAPRGAASNLLRVVGGTAVGPRERVVVVEVGSNWLVLGVAPGRVSALAEMPRQEMAPPTAAETPKDFPGWLKHVMERRNAPPR